MSPEVSLSPGCSILSGRRSGTRSRKEGWRKLSVLSELYDRSGLPTRVVANKLLRYLLLVAVCKKAAQHHLGGLLVDFSPSKA